MKAVKRDKWELNCVYGTRTHLWWPFKTLNRFVYYLFSFFFRLSLHLAIVSCIKEYISVYDRLRMANVSLLCVMRVYYFILALSLWTVYNFLLLFCIYLHFTLLCVSGLCRFIEI